MTTKGDFFKQQLIDLQKKHREIGDVRGIGLMNAIELIQANGSPDTEKAAAVVAHLFSQNILVYTCGVRGNILRFMPPLNVETDILNQVIDVLDQSFFVTGKESV